MFDSRLCLIHPWVAGATPLELSTALMSAGSWGVVHEPSASGPLNADVLDNTNNVMVNTAMFHAVTFQPQSLQVSAVSSVGLQPLSANLYHHLVWLTCSA